MPSRTRELVAALNRANQSSERLELASQLVDDLSGQWDQHPHSAMEWLELAVKELPLALSHSIARRVVVNWKQKPTYRPDAGGNADHCYMSALILSENYDLAEPAWAKPVLKRTIKKELGLNRFEKMPDSSARKAIVEALARSLE